MVAALASAPATRIQDSQYAPMFEIPIINPAIALPLLPNTEALLQPIEEKIIASGVKIQLTHPNKGIKLKGIATIPNTKPAVAIPFDFCILF